MTDQMQRPTLFFEDIQLGVTAVTEPITVIEDEMIAFAKHWDPMPIHIDRDAAAKSQFGGITASSVYTMGLKNLLVKQLITEESVICLLGFTEGRLPSALKAGRAVRLEATWLEKRLSNSQPDRGIVSFHIRLVTDADEVVLDFVETILLRTRC